MNDRQTIQRTQQSKEKVVAREATRAAFQPTTATNVPQQEPSAQLKGTPTAVRNQHQRSLTKQTGGSNNMYMSPPQTQKTDEKKAQRTRNTGGPQPEAQQQAVTAQQQQQAAQQKPSRTDNCNCPDIVEEKVKKVPEGEPPRYIRYSKGRFLGKGGFAKCYEVKRLEPIETEDHRNKTWALKVVPKANLMRTKARQKLTSEIKIHSSLHHENVVRFDRYFEDLENVYLMLDICQNQSLSDLLRRRKRLHEVEARCYINQLVLACQYIHGKNIIHRDLKLGNLFLTDRMQLKVGDFGLAAQVFYAGERKKTVCGTPNYLAPEVLESSNGHSFEVDYWSIGVILYTMLCGRPPFESQEVKNTYRKIKAGVFQFPNESASLRISIYAKDFIRKCLIVDPAKRMDLQEMIDHDFISLAALPAQLPAQTLVSPPTEAFQAAYRLPEQNCLHGGVSPITMQSASQAQLPTTKRANALMSTQSPTNFNKLLQGVGPCQVDCKQTLRATATTKDLRSAENYIKSGCMQARGTGTQNYQTAAYNCQQFGGNRMGAAPSSAQKQQLYSPLIPNKDSQFDNAQLMMTGRTPNGVTEKNGLDVTPNARDIICSEFEPIATNTNIITSARDRDRGLRTATSNVKVGTLNANCDDKALLNNFMQTQQIMGLHEGLGPNVGTDDVQLRNKKVEGSQKSSPVVSPDGRVIGIAHAASQNKLRRQNSVGVVAQQSKRIQMKAVSTAAGGYLYSHQQTQNRDPILSATNQASGVPKTPVRVQQFTSVSNKGCNVTPNTSDKAQSLRMMLTKSGSKPQIIGGGYNSNANQCRSPAIIHGGDKPIGVMTDQAYATQQKPTVKDSSTELAKIYDTCATKFDIDDLVTKDENQPNTELVERFVDFSSKYGLGYKLSNGSYGVHFNDSTKLITHPNLFHFDYVERNKNKVKGDEEQKKEGASGEIISSYNFFDYPPSINKKVVLLQHFKSYLDGNSKFKPLTFDFSKGNAPERPISLPLNYIKKWKKASKAVLMRNSNKVIQVVFQDASELILCSGSGQVTFVNAKASSVRRVPLNTTPGSNLNLEIEEPSLFKRLQYAKEILMQMVNSTNSTTQGGNSSGLAAVLQGCQTATLPTASSKREFSAGGMSSGATRVSNSRQNVGCSSSLSGEAVSAQRKAGTVSRQQQPSTVSNGPNKQKKECVSNNVTPYQQPSQQNKSSASSKRKLTTSNPKAVRSRFDQLTGTGTSQRSSLVSSNSGPGQLPHLSQTSMNGGAFSQRSSTLNLQSSSQQLSASSRGQCGRKSMPGAPIKQRSTAVPEVCAEEAVPATINNNKGSLVQVTNGTMASNGQFKAQQASVNRLYSYKTPGVPQVISGAHHTRNNTGTSVSNRSLGANNPGSTSQHTSSTTFNTSGQGGATAPTDRQAPSQQAAQTKVLNAKQPGNTFSTAPQTCPNGTGNPAKTQIQKK